jgi:rod shape-determining protein MreD
MKEKYRYHFKIIFNLAITIFLGMLLTILPLPAQFFWFYPSWVLMILIFWLTFFPDRVNLFVFWLVGLLMDLLMGTLIGQTAFIFVAIAYIILRFFNRFASFVIWRQSLLILLLTAINMFLVYCINALTGDMSLHVIYFSTPLLNALLWPIIFVCLTYFYRPLINRNK